MISTFATVVLSLIATSAVSALAVPRATAPQGWDTAALESYDTYHCRYIALQCQNQHNTQFFSDCCHPLAAGESASALPAQCQLPSGSSCSSGELVSTASASASFTSSTTVNFTPAPTTSSSSAPVNVAPPPTTKHTSTYTSSASNVASTTAPSTGSSDGSLNYGGFATYFYQNGVAGACGTVHSDSDFICAIDQTRYGNSGNTSPLCGQQVRITNTDNGNTVVVTIADDCPTCANENSIDLSVAAFQALDSLSVGDIPITWSFT
ncbi:RlpA-like double-psi beta-barrel-protein domain-containing protein-containing protein [Suillus subaureus]|uniref:RlpA-like double-psi beta-barrel-protein domain-containing protein-containing protein n=1 Tax=Suillus subaureus TaxID=48587 RepID=A0A9P7EQB3_9AGAM|nr:RlpA-like double-psi beta-barrel-protein domain-containing protein-containing protein [Suillus subaureus]KAG1827213.1 RlpA-like double-psi beta-barrel-protein domain-containing protein-containing protein [Suillus subaureus]